MQSPSLPTLRKRLKRKFHDALYYRPGIKRVNCTLSNEQYQQLSAAAKQAGMNHTQYLKAAAFAYMNTQYLVPENLEQALWRLTGQLHAAGNNLNQIARHVNTEKKASNRTLNQAKSLIEEMDERITAFVRSPAEISQSQSRPYGDQVDDT
jgi:N-acetylneuraminic acid mutarotase